MATLVWILGAVFMLNVLIAAWLVGLELIERRRLDKEIREVDTLWRSLTMPQPQSAGWGSPLSVGVKQRTPVLHRLPAPPRSVGKASVGLAVAASALWVLVAALGPGEPRSVVEARGLETSLQSRAELARQTDASSARGDRGTAGAAVSSQAPSSPTGVAISAAVAAQPRSSTAIHLDWAGVKAATGYEVERKEDETQQGWLTIVAVQGNVTSYMDGGLDSGTTYFYRVSAITGSGAAPPSAVVSATTPGGAIPSATTVTAVAALDTITLAWVDVYDETGYRIELSRDGGDWMGIGTTGQDVTVYTHTALSPGTTYLYRIVATNTAGDSAPSNVVTATTETEKVTEPPGDGNVTPSPNSTPAEDVAPATGSADGALAESPGALTETVAATEASGGTLTEAVPPVSEVSVVPEPTP
ncbi:MAG: fibronectin type III domain-containing protein [Actinomycetota bacterium]|nr:fibronectin type III domain-containing protein [Actinomycetota bacterium]